MAATAVHRLTLDPMGKYSNAFFSETTNMQSESRLDNGVVSINLSRTFFTGIGHVLEYIDQVLKIHSF
jgi:spore germination protein GerM